MDTPGLNWLEAREACKDLGADLAVPNSADQARVIRSLTEKSFVYLGIVRDNNDKDSFVNIDGFPLEWTNWAPGEPNNFGIENCIEMDISRNDKWNDLGCSYIKFRSAAACLLKLRGKL